MAAAATPATSDELRAGRLLAEPEPLGFAGLGEPSSGNAPKRQRRPAAERKQRASEQAARRKAKVEGAQRELREAKAEAARLSRDAERANARVVELERALARLRPSADPNPYDTLTASDPAHHGPLTGAAQAPTVRQAGASREAT